MLVFNQAKGLVYSITVQDQSRLDRVLGALGLAQDWARAVGNGSKYFGQGYATFADEVYKRLVGDCQPLSTIKPENRWAEFLHQSLSGEESFNMAIANCQGNSYIAASTALRFLTGYLEELKEFGCNGANPDRVEMLRNQLRQQKKIARDQVLKALQEALEQTGASNEQSQAARDEALSQMQQGQTLGSEEMGKAIAQAMGEGVDSEAIAQAMASAQQGVSEKLQQAMAQTVQQGLEARKEVEQFEENFGAMIKALPYSCREALEEAELIQTVAKGCGIDPHDGNADIKLLAEVIKMCGQGHQGQMLRNILQMSGKLRPIAERVQNTKTQLAQREIVGVTKGQTLKRLLPMEVVKMKQSPTMFAKDYLNENLSHYEMGGKERMGRGPIVLCLDISGSTMGSVIEWEKAIAFVLMEIAAKEKRCFHLIEFTDYVEQSVSFKPVNRYSATKKRQQKLGLIKALTKYGSSGGTSFSRPLSEALNVIKRKSKLKEADIIFITDGEGSAKPSIVNRLNEAKAKTGLRIHSIAIGVNVCTSVLNSFSSDVHTIDPNELGNDCANSDVLVDVFGV